MAAKRKCNTLTQLQKAILLYMSEQGYTPKSQFESCHTIIMGFIEHHGNYFCDSISEMMHSIYAMSRMQEFDAPYTEAIGFDDERFKDKNYKIRSSELYAECRLSQAGLKYVSEHKALDSLKNRYNLIGKVQLQIKTDNEKSGQLSCFHEALLLDMATRGYWPTKQYVKYRHIIVNFIKLDGVKYTDYVSSVVDALYQLASIRINNDLLIEMQYHEDDSIRDIGIIKKKENPTPEYIEARLSKAGFDYVITNNLVNKLRVYSHRPTRTENQSSTISSKG